MGEQPRIKRLLQSAGMHLEGPPLAHSASTCLCPSPTPHRLGPLSLRSAFLYKWALGASEKLHTKSIHRMLFAPLGFFLTVGWAGSTLRGGGQWAACCRVGCTHPQDMCPAYMPGCPSSHPAPCPPSPPPQTPVGDLLVSFTKDQDVLDEALPDALYYAGIYALILLATTITVSVT